MKVPAELAVPHSLPGGAAIVAATCLRQAFCGLEEKPAQICQVRRQVETGELIVLEVKVS